MSGVLSRRSWLFVLALVAVAIMALPAAGTRAAPDSKGTEFWLMFNQNEGSANLFLFITSDTNTSGTVDIPGLGFTTPFTVTANTVTTVAIPAGAQASGSDAIENKGVRVTALDEVTVYGLNQRLQTTDAFLGLPTDVLGTEYIVLAYRNDGLASAGLGTQFGVVAVEDGTTVTITPSVTTGARTAGVPYDIVLNEGQTYQLRNTQSSTADLTGTVIASDRPVAVFGGHRCGRVPPDVPFCDHMVEQLPSVDTWGRSFVTMPLATRIGGDTFRFLAAVDGTTVNVNGAPVATLDRGEHHEQIIDGPAVIDASHEILVAQYSNSTTFDGVTSDPFMMIIPPYEQFLGEYTISTPAVVFNINLVNIVAPDAAVGAITLNGAPIDPTEFTPIGTSGFSGAQVSVAVGSHHLSGPLPFGVFAYGFAAFDSYGYPGGAAFAPVATVTNVALSPPTDTNPVGTEHCVTALVTDQFDEAVAGVRVDFEVTGTHSVAGFASTDASGEAEFCYTGTEAGDDTITGSVGALSATATKSWVDDPTEVCYPLFAGQDMLVGSVCVEEVDDDLVITYKLDDDTIAEGWGIVETHLHVSDDLTDVPTNRAGNPVIGHFEHSDEHDPAVTEFVYTIEDHGFEDPIFIAAHAVIERELVTMSGELVINGGFEEPEVTHSALWDIFESDEVPGWGAEWTAAVLAVDSFGGMDRPEEAKIELHRGVNGWLPHSGEQYTELDSDWDGPDGNVTGEPASVILSQEVDASSWDMCTLSYAWSPRPGHDDNSIEVRWNGAVVGTHSASGVGNANTVWTVEEVAIDAIDGVLEFEETGTPDSLGMFLDSVSIECSSTEIERETAWGAQEEPGQTRFVERGNWATYIIHPAPEDNDND